MKAVRITVTAIILIAIWQVIVFAGKLPHYILPGPLAVLKAGCEHFPLLMIHAKTTLLEILAGLFLGILMGASAALLMIISGTIKRWVLPILVVTQAVPVFALAPVLVLWFGYGMMSKIVMAILIIFFPVTTALYDGMRRINPELLELTRLMNARPGAMLRLIKIPMALPVFASGLRTATAVAPIGAIVGEWIGASSGLGYLMLHANARMQIDLMFAALFILSLMALSLYFTIDALMNRLVYWTD